MMISQTGEERPGAAACGGVTQSFAGDCGELATMVTTFGGSVGRRAASVARAHHITEEGEMEKRKLTSRGRRDCGASALCNNEVAEAARAEAC